MYVWFPITKELVEGSVSHANKLFDNLDSCLGNAKRSNVRNTDISLCFCEVCSSSEYIGYIIDAIYEMPKKVDGKNIVRPSREYLDAGDILIPFLDKWVDMTGSKLFFIKEIKSYKI